MFDSDLDIFFADFALPVAYHNVGSAGGTFPGILDAPGRRVEGSEAGYVTDGPTLLAKSADLAAAEVRTNSTILTVSGTDYQAIQILPDGTGLSIIALTRDFDT